MDLVERTSFDLEQQQQKLNPRPLQTVAQPVSQLNPPPLAINGDVVDVDVVIDAKVEQILEPDEDRQSPESLLDELSSVRVEAAAHRPVSALSKTKKSVRISSGTTYRTDDFSDIYDNHTFGGHDESCRGINHELRSKSVSPRRSRSAVTTPKPFRMTQR